VGEWKSGYFTGEKGEWVSGTLDISLVRMVSG
jgi:hypothetical protein